MTSKVYKSVLFLFVMEKYSLLLMGNKWGFGKCGGLEGSFAAEGQIIPMKGDVLCVVVGECEYTAKVYKRNMDFSFIDGDSLCSSKPVVQAVIKGKRNLG